MIIDHPYIFFVALYLFALTLGAWLGHRFSQARIARLLRRIENQRTLLKFMAPHRTRRL
jgi:hypothetical protein